MKKRRNMKKIGMLLFVVLACLIGGMTAYAAEVSSGNSDVELQASRSGDTIIVSLVSKSNDLNFGGIGLYYHFDGKVTLDDFSVEENVNQQVFNGGNAWNPQLLKLGITSSNAVAPAGTELIRFTHTVPGGFQKDTAYVFSVTMDEAYQGNADLVDYPWNKDTFQVVYSESGSAADPSSGKGTGSTGNGSGSGNTGTSTEPADPTPTQPSSPTTPTEPAAPIPASGSVLNRTDHIAYVKGYDDGTVRPGGSITRAETATMLYRLLSAERRDAIFTADNSFSDVAAADWFNKAVSSMSSGGYIRGYEDGTFLGNRNITRAEFVTILSRFADASAGSASFTDVPAGHWAKNSIAVAAENGWVNGYEDGTFQPDKAITRAEAMTMINRFLNRGVNAQSQLGEVSTFSDNGDASAWYYYEIIEATNDHEYTGARPSEQWTSNTVNITYDMDKYERP